MLLCSLAVLIYSGADPLPDASFRRSGAQKFGSGTPCIVSCLCYTVRLIETAVNHKSLRIFWALCPPEAVASSISLLIGALQRDLKHPAEALGLRTMFTKTAHLHITVKFLGSVPEETVGDLLELVRTRLQVRTTARGPDAAATWPDGLPRATAPTNTGRQRAQF